MLCDSTSCSTQCLMARCLFLFFEPCNGVGKSLERAHSACPVTRMVYVISSLLQTPKVGYRHNDAEAPTDDGYVLDFTPKSMPGLQVPHSKFLLCSSENCFSKPPQPSRCHGSKLWHLGCIPTGCNQCVRCEVGISKWTN